MVNIIYLMVQDYWLIVLLSKRKQNYVSNELN